MARDRFYPMMRMMNPDNMIDTFMRDFATPFFDDSFSGFGTKVDLYRKDGT